MCARLLSYNVLACRQAMIFVGGGRFRFRNTECKVLSSVVLNRNLYQTPRRSDQGGKNVNSLNIKECGDKSKGGGGFQWIIAALAAAGVGGLAYFLGQSKSGGEGKVEKVEEPRPVVPPTRSPENPNDLPKKVPYLLVGGGTASFSAFRAIKSNDPKAKVLVISNELFKPYMRPPLSKELWYASEPGVVPKDYRFKQWTGAERSLFFEPDEFFVDPTKLLSAENGGIAVAQGYTVKKVDPRNRIVTLSEGVEIRYEKCLLATGCTPKSLPVFSNAPKSIQDKIMFYRSPNDFEKLKACIDEKKSITIIGSGFLGSELSCSLASYSKARSKINQIFPESGNMSKVLPEYLSKWTTKKVEQLGVCVVPDVQVKDVSREQSALKLTLSNGQIILTDIAVVCVGCEANTDIATVSGLEVDSDLGGFVVNAELEARQNLFVAGDASCFYDPLLGRRRLEHHDHSVISGRLAGENMVGKDDTKKAYEHQSMFWSDLGPGIGYEGIGRTDASLPTVGVFALPSEEVRTTDNLNPGLEPTEQKPAAASTVGTPEAKKEVKIETKGENDDSSEGDYGKGVIFYLKDDKIVGILLWNLFNRIGLARTIINQNKTYKDLNEVAKLFEIHS